MHVLNFSLEEKDLTRPQKIKKSYTGFLWINYKMLILAHKIIHPSDTGNIPAYLKTNLKIKNNENITFTRSQLGPTFVLPNSN